MTVDRKLQEMIRGRRQGAKAAATPGKRTLSEALPPAVAAPPALGAAPAAGEAPSADVHAAAAQGTSGPGGPLPFGDQIQRSFGAFDVGRIQAHSDGAAAAGARAMGAEAFATGDHVAFAGPPDLHTAAHEAAHVVQQRAGVHLKGGVGSSGDRYEQHADAVADLVVQGKSSESLLASFVGPVIAGNAAGEAVQRQQATGAACDKMPFPKVQNDSPTGTTCRRFDGVTTYRMVSEAQLKASGYKFWTSDGTFDKWVRVDGSSELWLQLPRINAATSEKAIGQLRSIVAARKAALDEIATLAHLANSSDPNVASEAQAELEERIGEFPGFDDDYALVPQLRQQVDADHRKAFEDQVKQLVQLRDRWDPQSDEP
jgi:hypothetical protein